VFLPIVIVWQTGLAKRGSSKTHINPPYNVLNCIIWFGGVFFLVYERFVYILLEPRLSNPVYRKDKTIM